MKQSDRCKMAKQTECYNETAVTRLGGKIRRDFQTWLLSLALMGCDSDEVQEAMGAPVLKQSVICPIFQL